MLTVALFVLFAANVSLVVLLAAMWAARSPRHPQHADFLELAGVLRTSTVEYTTVYLASLQSATRNC